MDNEEIKRDDKQSPIPEAGILGVILGKFSDLFAVMIWAAAIILVIEVFLRYVFNAPTIWGHETVVFLTACSSMFGGLLVAPRDRHIRVVIIYDYLPPKAKRVLNVIISFLCFLSTLFFTWAVWIAVNRAIFTPQGDFRVERSGTAFNAPYPGLLRVFLFVVMILLTLQFLTLTINYFRKKD
ncbi:MAG: TRAP transporter small permease subunit [Rhizobiales bacterium]|nr:TRAP transporter small permease subunit [Hyphomicrobiales bacterium]